MAFAVSVILRLENMVKGLQLSLPQSAGDVRRDSNSISNTSARNVNVTNDDQRIQGIQNNIGNDDDNPDTNISSFASGFNTGKQQTQAIESTRIWNKELYQAIQNNAIIPFNSRTVLVGDGAHGEIQIDGKLVVNIDETYMFWNNAQIKLCSLLQNMTLSDSNFQGSDLLLPSSTTTTTTTTNTAAVPLLNATIDCKELVKKEGLGQGNWVTALYCTRIAAAKAKVDFQFQCADGMESADKLLLPWFAGFQKAPNNSDSWPFAGQEPTRDQACTPRYPHIRVDKIADRIIHDVRKMAVALVGSQNYNIRQHASLPLLLDQPPIIRNVVLDDVAIHFRCGDVMGGVNRDDFGMIKFTEYRKHISPSAKSIGILTQPFERGRNRKTDSSRTSWCRNATYLLVETLQKDFPEARISIHNGMNETLPLAYARLTMAYQSFTSLSSFGIFPVIGSIGEGYFQEGNRGVNPFVKHLPSMFPNLHMMTAPKLASGKMFRMNLSSILDWFVAADDNYTYS
jgi:hypothetical protein